MSFSENFKAFIAGFLASSVESSIKRNERLEKEQVLMKDMADRHNNSIKEAMKRSQEWQDRGKVFKCDTCLKWDGKHCTQFPGTTRKQTMCSAWRDHQVYR